ncbi:MAG: efflux RND transporter periplasmic adaptor subunit [Pseudanabaena sp. M57BS1SP1A06MG]|nr:efflux RND transporter periplasmic adaptor subunit [Pseudanabaena sp. M53BS1SP1A06MG]MCA6582689.1 efflux RND transporter periplasmic adaptor subunit [Pseudanabaena sp. M34BS1SP1A06MG]MCA6593493.1 efflux RND transporter periplasmic adaptor subunit [Pseudanabaena sp. M38BS1SP1A06MG]MCA6599067.1 efflux RND transporter periplasmic adaptor subunit [Pseudanabaena sp. M57BS1SP1A06MG]
MQTEHQLEPKEDYLPEELSDFPNELASPKKSFLGRWKWRIGVILILALVGGGGYYTYTQMIAPASQQGSRKRDRVISIKRTNLPIIVTANGTIQPEKSINVSPKSSGRLKTLLVKEGQSVNAGQILAYMDESNMIGQLTQADGQLAAAQASLDLLRAGNRSQDIAQVQANLANAQSTLEQSEIIYRQNQQLYKEGAIASRDLDTSRTTMEANRAKVTQAREALSLQRAGSRPEDIDRAQAQVVVAAGTLQTVQSQLEDTIIRAPFDGVVVRKYADPGAFVTPTTSGSAVSSATASSILALATNNQVVANVAEANIAQIAVGQEVSFQVDAYPNKKFSGRVVSISPQAIVNQNVTSFEVKAEITSKDKNLLRSGMNASLEFRAGQLKDVLVVPTVAIVRQQGSTGVYVKTEQSATPVFTQIETGVTVDDKTEVKSGLNGDEKIFVSFPEGSRPKSEPRGVPGLTPSTPQRQRG